MLATPADQIILLTDD